jgi:hypothetical protein
VPKRNYGFEKRQKELNRQQKQEEKRQRRLERSESPPDEEEQTEQAPPETPRAHQSLDGTGERES